MAEEMDALTAEVLSEGASAPVRGLIRMAARWWRVERWWLFHVSWSRPLVVLSRSKRRTVAMHAQSGVGHPCQRAALDRAARQCIRFDLEQRVRASDRPERWYGEEEWRRIQERERRAGNAGPRPPSPQERDSDAPMSWGLSLPHTAGTRVR